MKTWPPKEQAPTDRGIDVDDLLARREIIEAKRKAATEAFKLALDDQRVRTPGYLLPLGFEGERSRIETRLVVSNGTPVIAHTASTDTLKKALQKALAWNEKLLTGTAKTMAEIAKAEGVTQRFVSQRIQLAYLAPDIMKRIIEGDVPDTLTLESFKNRQIPPDWREQSSFFQLAQ